MDTTKNGSAAATEGSRDGKDEEEEVMLTAIIEWQHGTIQDRVSFWTCLPSSSAVPCYVYVHKVSIVQLVCLIDLYKKVVRYPWLILACDEFQLSREWHVY